MHTKKTKGTKSHPPIPKLSPQQFERLTAREAEAFLYARFRAFVLRGFDCNVALRRTVHL